MLSEQELEGIRTLTLHLQRAEERLVETGERTEHLFCLQRKLSEYVGPLLGHITELEQEIEARENSGWERSEFK